MRRMNAGPASPLDRFVLSMPNLGANQIDEPNDREVVVWHPGDCDTKGLPMLICLAAYLNSGSGLTGWRNFGENLPERLDRLYASGKMGPAVVVFVDSYNRLGGNQFVNSPIIGNWANGLAEDLVPAIEEKYQCGGIGRRGLFGHSSGGYGALYNLMGRPDIWSCAASHAGDCGFEWVYQAELPKALRVLAHYDFNVPAFLDDFWSQEKPRGDQISALMVLALSASYDPITEEEELRIRLPVDHRTCELLPPRWQNWQAFDPLSLIHQNYKGLQNEKYIYLDCGKGDEYNILYGTRRLSAALTQYDIEHDFEEFDGGHGTIGPRYEVSLPAMIKYLTRV